MTSAQRVSEYGSMETEAPVRVPDKDPPAQWPTEGVVGYNSVVRYSSLLV